MLEKKYRFHKAKSLKSVRNEQEMFDRKFDDLTVKVISQSNSKYEFIPKYKLIELRTLLISKSEYFDISHKIKLIKILGTIEEGRSMYLLESIANITLNGIEVYFKSAKERDLREQEIFTIFKALPYLTICHKDYIKFYENLLDYLIYYDIEILKLEQKILILHSLISLDFHITHEKKLYDLSKKFLESDSINELLNSLKSNIIFKLWEASVILNSHFNEVFFNEIFKYADYKIKIGTKSQCVTSEIQLFFYQKIKELLPSNGKNSIQLEYQKCPYSLDIAFPKFKINIEIDGIHHERLNKLRPNDKIRDYVLTKHFGWKVFRIKSDSMLHINNNNFCFKQIEKILDIPEIYSLLDSNSILEFYRKNYSDKSLNQNSLNKNQNYFFPKKIKYYKKIKYTNFINSEEEYIPKQITSIENVYVAENISTPNTSKKVNKKKMQYNIGSVFTLCRTLYLSHNRKDSQPALQSPNFIQQKKKNRIADDIAAQRKVIISSHTKMAIKPNNHNETTPSTLSIITSKGSKKNSPKSEKNEISVKTDSQSRLSANNPKPSKKKNAKKPTTTGKIATSSNEFFTTKQTSSKRSDNKRIRSKQKVSNTKSPC